MPGGQCRTRAGWAGVQGDPHSSAVLGCGASSSLLLVVLLEAGIWTAQSPGGSSTNIF